MINMINTPIDWWLNHYLTIIYPWYYMISMIFPNFGSFKITKWNKTWRMVIINRGVSQSKHILNGRWAAKSPNARARHPRNHNAAAVSATFGPFLGHRMKKDYLWTMMDIGVICIYYIYIYVYHISDIICDIYIYISHIRYHLWYAFIGYNMCIYIYVQNTTQKMVRSNPTEIMRYTHIYIYTHYFSIFCDLLYLYIYIYMD